MPKVIMHIRYQTKISLGSRVAAELGGWQERTYTKVYDFEGSSVAADDEYVKHIAMNLSKGFFICRDSDTVVFIPAHQILDITWKENKD